MRSRSSKPSTRICRPSIDEVEAATSNAIVHDVLKPAGTFPDLKHLDGKRGTNIALDFRLRRGDADAAFATADHIFEHEFRTQQVMHTPLEPFVAVADAGDGRITIHTASQGPSFVRIEIARLLGWPENRVRIRTAYLGGGFGAKLYIKLEALVAALSLLARRPVKIALTMEEQFFTITKHPATTRIKTAVTKDGRITARRCEVWWNGGAYADVGPRVTQKSGFTAAGPYDIRMSRSILCRLYQPPAGRRAARLRRAATVLGLREPERHDRARAGHRSRRVPAQEHAARGRRAGDRHEDDGCCDGAGARNAWRRAWE